jgi:glycosyltransferase involved in cell wall biosynthesis
VLSGEPARPAAEPDLDGLTVLVPAYNEEHGIAGVVQGLRHGLGPGTQLIVVDDGSTDGTRQALAAAAAGVRVLRHGENRGYGAALKTGIQATETELVCITDADGTYPNERIPELCRILRQGGHDMVVGARTGANVRAPLVRKPAKWAIARMVDLIARRRIPDFNSGLRVMRREAILPFLPLLPDGFSFTTTITLAMTVNGYSLEYVPIDYHARIGRSKISPIADTLRFIRLVIMVGLYFAPLRVFMPLAGLLFLLAAAWGLVSAFAFGRLADVSTLVIVMTSVQVASLGLLAELINRRLINRLRREPEPAAPLEHGREGGL